MGKYFRVKIRVSFIHVVPYFAPATCTLSVAMVVLDLSLSSVLKFSVLFLPDAYIFLTSTS